MLKNYKLEIKWAIIFSLTSLLWFSTEKILGFHDVYIKKQMVVSYFFAVPAILIYFLAIKEKKTLIFRGVMTWKQGAVSGIYISLFVAVFGLFVNYVCLEFVSPDYFNNISEYLISSKIMTQQGAKEYFNLKSYLIEGVFGALSVGVVTSAIVAFFLQTKN